MTTTELKAPKTVIGITGNTNIKNLPDLDEGRLYFTEHGYSQSYPWVEISRTKSGKTVTLAKVVIQRDPEWKPNIIPGGFCGHCDNQHDQTWLFDRIDLNQTRRVRMTKKGWKSGSTRFSEGYAIEFYDYNF